MANRYNDRDYDRFDERDYDDPGARRADDYGRGGSYGRTGPYGDDYGPAGRTPGGAGGNYGRDYGDYDTGPARTYERGGLPGRDYERGGYGPRDYEREDYGGYRAPAGRSYGSAAGGGYDRDYERDYERDYDAGSGRGYDRSGPVERSSYGRATERGYDPRGYERGRGGREAERDNRPGDERGWWNRVSDEVASWFGDEEAERRRRMDEQHDPRYAGAAGPHRGRGPRNYRRTDERVRDDINDRLTEHPYLDASNIEVAVQGGDVMLTGTVESRRAKRLAEDVAASVSGVQDVQNNLRVGGERERLGAGDPAGSPDLIAVSETTLVTGTITPPAPADPITTPDPIGGGGRTRKASGS